MPHHLSHLLSHLSFDELTFRYKFKRIVTCRHLEPRGHRHVWKSVKPRWGLRHRLLFPEWLILYGGKRNTPVGSKTRLRPGEGMSVGVEADRARVDGSKRRTADSTKKSTKRSGLETSPKEILFRLHSANFCTNHRWDSRLHLIRKSVEEWKNVGFRRHMERIRL